jgi:Xaa-Pro aminopeptidase
MRRVAAVLAAAGEAGDGAEDPALRFGGAPLTAGRLRAEIALALAGHGLDQPRGNIVAAGRDAAVPHTAGRDDRVLRGGEALVVDLFPRGALFADCTRTFCVGQPPEALTAAHRAVAAALEIARGGAVAGTRGWDLQLAVCERLGAAGYPTQLSDPESVTGYVHNLGHGVGFELHEYPSFRKESGAEGLLEEGDVFTLEPGLYDPEGGWGVRLEDLVYLGPEGLENLTPLPYDLDPRAWPAQSL